MVPLEPPLGVFSLRKWTTESERIGPRLGPCHAAKEPRSQAILQPPGRRRFGRIPWFSKGEQPTGQFRGASRGVTRGRTLLLFKTRHGLLGDEESCHSHVAATQLTFSCPSRTNCGERGRRGVVNPREWPLVIWARRIARRPKPTTDRLVQGTPRTVSRWCTASRIFFCHALLPRTRTRHRWYPGLDCYLSINRHHLNPRLPGTGDAFQGSSIQPLLWYQTRARNSRNMRASRVGNIQVCMGRLGKREVGLSHQ